LRPAPCRDATEYMKTLTSPREASVYFCSADYFLKSMATSIYTTLFPGQTS